MTDLERAKDVLTEILRRMGIEATVDAREEEERIILDVKGSETALVIGKKGATLDSLQFLVGRVVHRGIDSDAAGTAKPIVVDAEDYRSRRAESLVALAHRLSEKAIRTRRVVEVDPMSAHDRRIIHLALGAVPGVMTRSEGEGAERRLLIIPCRDKM